MIRAAAALFLACLVVAGPARPEVIDSQPGGFTVRESRLVAAPAAKVWAVLVTPAAWWDSSHTFSKDAHNLTLSPTPGGFWQETLPGGGGGVRHMVVVFVDPPTTLRLEGALGPLQAFGATGHLTYKLTPLADGTSITETYDVGGHAPGGLDKLADPVNEVLDEQLGRLKARVEAGGAR